MATSAALVLRVNIPDISSSKVLKFEAGNDLAAVKARLAKLVPFVLDDYGVQIDTTKAWMQLGQSLLSLGIKDKDSAMCKLVDELLRQNGLETEGIGRISALSSEISELVERLPRPFESSLLTNKSPHLLISAMKRYIRQLEPPLFSPAQYRQLADSADRVETYRKVLAQIPPPARATVRLVATLALLISNREARNKMNMENMGIIWGPTLFSSPLISADESGVQMRMAVALFTNFSSIFGEELRDDPGTNPASLRDVKYLKLAGLTSEDVDQILAQVSGVIGTPAPAAAPGKATESMMGERLLESMLGDLDVATSQPVANSTNSTMTAGGPPPIPGPSPVRPAAAPARTASPSPAAPAPAPDPTPTPAHWTPGPLLPPAQQPSSAQPRAGSGYAILPTFLPETDSPNSSRIRATTEYQDMPIQQQSLADSAIDAYLGKRLTRVDTAITGFVLPDLNAPFLPPQRQASPSQQPPAQQAPAAPAQSSPLYNSQPNVAIPPLFSSQPTNSPLYSSQPNVGTSPLCDSQPSPTHPLQPIQQTQPLQPIQPVVLSTPVPQPAVVAPQEPAPVPPSEAQRQQPPQPVPTNLPPADLSSFPSTLQALLVRPADPVVAAAFANYYKTQSSQVQVQLEAYSVAELATLATHLLGALT